MERILALLFLLFISTGAAEEAIPSSPIDIRINELCYPEIIEFTLSPQSVAQNQYVYFDVTVKNEGNIPFSALVRINISGPSSDSIQSDNPVFIPKESNATISISWFAGERPSGNYIATATINATANVSCPALPENRTFFIQPPPPPRVAVAPPVVPTPIVPPPEIWVHWVEIPVLVEAKLGERVEVSIKVKNPSERAFSLRVDVSGFEKIDFFPDEISLPPEAEGTIKIIIDIPRDVTPADYTIRISLSGEIQAENFFILRVKPYLPEYEKPTLSRTVKIDKEKKESIVSLEIKNADRFVERIEVIEEIPKEIAESVDEIEFITPPAVILEPDPVVKFVLLDVYPFERREISYRVKKILDEYSPYVYWPVRQTNIYYTYAPPKIRVEKIDVPSFFPGEKSEVALTVSNMDVIPIDLSVKLEAPSGWAVEPERLTRSISPGISTFLFSIKAPEDAPQGTYILSFLLSYAGEEIRIETTVIVEEVSPLLYAVPLSLVIGAFLFIRRRVILARRLERMRRLRWIEYRQRFRR